MQDFYATVIFLMAYFMTKNFLYSLFALACIETLPSFQKWWFKQSIPLQTLWKMIVLWISVMLTWAFNSPLYFQCKTSLIYLIMALTLQVSPQKWILWFHKEIAQDFIDFSEFQNIRPKIAQIFLAASVLNALAILYLSLASWMIFKLVLATIISGRIFMLTYPYLVFRTASTQSPSVQETTAKIIFEREIGDC